MLRKYNIRVLRRFHLILLIHILLLFNKIKSTIWLHSCILNNYINNLLHEIAKKLSFPHALDVHNNITLFTQAVEYAAMLSHVYKIFYKISKGNGKNWFATERTNLDKLHSNQNIYHNNEIIA